MIVLPCPVARSIICSVCKRVKNRSTALGDHPNAAASCERDTQSCPRSTVIVDPPTLNFVGFQHAFSTSHANAPQHQITQPKKCRSAAYPSRVGRQHIHPQRGKPP